MKNITISLDNKLLEAGLQYAKKHNTSLNALIRRLQAQTVLPSSRDWLEECFSLMDQVDANFELKWERKDLYDV
ncbi:MAG: hypothetical protein KGZ41_08675 [Dethiobacter sp.]|mgnify:CR=1 FL=1|jgi:hypothetical protein|nr:hypothetical protein [Dethiobacter sp.]MBS3899756.1 hypothetical protein [Dethiobacter sp.]MBS3983856.1 hypothetical protein [Dethiobacter sp.]MCL4463644.1 hypothetical protein [Bacillota bacterium]MCL5993475.1 hypothetical protein [Bacillota bacterium]